MEPAQLAAFAKTATDLGMTQQQAEKYLTHTLSEQKAQAAANDKAVAQQDQTWLGQIRTKWGDKFPENAEHVKRGFDVVDPSGKIRAGLKAAGLTNWPEVIESMAELGRSVSEDKLFVQTAGKTNPNQKATPEQRILAEKKALVAQVVPPKTR